MELTNVEISCSVSPFIASTFERDHIKLTRSSGNHGGGGGGGGRGESVKGSKGWGGMY